MLPGKRLHSLRMAGQVATLLACLPPPAAAHIPTFGVGTVTRLVFQQERVLLTFDLSYASFWAQGEMLTADTDKSSSIEEPEAAAYQSRQWLEKIAPRLRVKLDGVEVPLQLASQRHENLLGAIFGVPFSLYYEVEVAVPPAPGGTERLIELEDTVVRNETPAQPRYSIPLVGHGSDDRARLTPRFLEPQSSALPDATTMSYELEGPRLAIRYRLEDPGWTATAAPRPAAETAAVAPTAAGLRGPEVRDEEAAAFAAALRDNLGWLEGLLALLLAVVYGAAHALAPGHGKSMVAAYLIGSRGRVRDAVLLGLFTTLAHTGSVFLFGVVIFIVSSASAESSQGHLSNLVIVGSKLFSGVLLVVLGLSLFWRRALALRRALRPERDHGSGADDPRHNHLHDHSHDHGHSQEHGHSHEHLHSMLQHGVPRLRDLLALGISGGIVPCPAALTVILISLQYTEKMVLALALLLAFSVGLGGVLVAIGVCLVTGKALLGSRWRPSGTLLRALPVASSLFIAGLGAFFCLATFREGRTQIVAMLRQLADWVE